MELNLFKPLNFLLVNIFQCTDGNRSMDASLLLLVEKFVIFYSLIEFLLKGR